MRRPARCRTALALATVLLAGTPFPSGRARADAVGDRLAAEIARWSAYLRDNTSRDAMWTDVKGAVETPLARAAQALGEDRRLLALLRLAPARENLLASQYLLSRPAAERKDDAAFEAEWKRVGTLLGDALRPPSPSALEGVAPAAVRAIGEVALPQARVFYDASLDYGRSTMPDAGLFYLGSAQAARDTVELSRSLSKSASLRAPGLRDLAPEIDALRVELLSLYRPPASIDEHREFITTSALLKEARELDSAALRYGALLRYLQAAQRYAALKPPAPADPASIRAGLAEAEGRFGADGVDHTIGRLFVEAAHSDLAAATTASPPAVAAAVASDVLPRYFAALEAPKPRATPPAPRATVTLVRWPYT